MTATATATGPQTETGRWVTMREAADELHCSPDSIRRRLRSRALHGRRHQTPQGFTWLVWIGPGAPPDGQGGAPHDDPGDLDAEPGGPPGGSSNGTQSAAGAAQGRHHGGAGAAPAGAEAAALASARAEEMARYSAALLAPLHAQLKELSRENGRLEERATHLQAERDTARAELELARAQLAEAIGPKAPPELQNGATHQGEERRRWWQRLFSWDTAEGGA